MVGNANGKEHSQCVDVNTKMIIKHMLKMFCIVDWINVAHARPVALSCEYGKEYSGSIKLEEFLTS